MVEITREFSRICVALVIACAIVSAIMLDSDLEDYVKKIISEFDQDSRSCRFDNVIDPPVFPMERSEQSRTHWRKKDFFLPRLFIWCPVAHYGSILCCPEHAVILEIGEWTNVITKNSCYRNPRLVYAIGGTSFSFNVFTYVDKAECVTFRAYGKQGNPESGIRKRKRKRNRNRNRNKSKKGR